MVKTLIIKDKQDYRLYKIRFLCIKAEFDYINLDFIYKSKINYLNSIL
jgi:hypothetical protein